MLTQEEKKEMEARDVHIWEARVYEQKTFKKIGQQFNLSIPRVSQIIKARDKRLNDFLTEAGEAWDKEEREKNNEI